MSFQVQNSTVSQGLPLSLTTNQSTRPVSVRTAQENEIDQINNTPNAKKLYNARVYGGIIGGSIPLITGLTSLIFSKINWKNSKPKSVFLALAGLAATALTIKGAQAGAAISKAITVFFNTRGNNKTE